MAHLYTRWTFLTGIILGALLAICLKQSVILQRKSGLKIFGLSSNYEKWFKSIGLKRRPISWDTLRYSNTTYHTESEYLFSKVNILCIVLVKKPDNYLAIKDTWAKGCNNVTSINLEQRNKIMPSRQVKVKSSWVHLCSALTEIDIKSFDWVLVVKDTSFIIMENLRYFVAPLNAEDGHYIGHAVKFWDIAYNSREPGYVLSKGSVKSFQSHVKLEKCLEKSYWNKEDYYLGKHLMRLNITPVNTLDQEGLSTFHPYNWYHVFNPGENYYKRSVFPIKCCSRKSVAFEATDGSRMYTFDYLFYKLQIFNGGPLGNRPFKETEPAEQVWKKFLLKQNIQRGNINAEEYYKIWEDLINDPNSFASNLKKEQLFDYD